MLWGAICCLKLSGILLGVHGDGGDWGLGKDVGGSRVIGDDCTLDQVGSGVECMKGTLPGAVHCEWVCVRLLGRAGSAALQGVAHFWGLTFLIGVGWAGVVLVCSLQGFPAT